MKIPDVKLSFLLWVSLSSSFHPRCRAISVRMASLVELIVFPRSVFGSRGDHRVDHDPSLSGRGFQCNRYSAVEKRPREPLLELERFDVFIERLVPVAHGFFRTDQLGKVISLGGLDDGRTQSIVAVVVTRVAAR